MKIIKMYSGEDILVDDDDYEKLLPFRWIKRSNGYATRFEYPDGKSGKRKHIFMHREVMGVDQIIDHINGNILDNRKSNLRLTNKTLNSANSKKHSRNKTGFKGVVYRKDMKNPYLAYVGYNNGQIYLGSYATKVEAAQAYDAKVTELFGDHAKTNELLGLFNSQNDQGD